MNRREIMFALGAIGAGAATALRAAEVGDMAPEFSLPATSGETVALSAFRGQKTVVLAFFPKAFTGGCTREMKGYQAGISRFSNNNSVVFGVSTDNLETNKKFATSLGLKFALLSDPGGETAKKYGVYNAERKFASRKTFVIGADGKIVHIDEGSKAIDPSGAAAACSRLKKHTGT